MIPVKSKLLSPSMLLFTYKQSIIVTYKSQCVKRISSVFTLRIIPRFRRLSPETFASPSNLTCESR